MTLDRFSRKQLKVLSWWVHEDISKKYHAIIADGAIRSGKTISMSISFVLWSMTQFEDQNFAICGKTVESCKRNVITPMLTALDGIVTFRVLQSKNYIEAHYKGRCNRYYIFGGKDEGSAALIQGITLAGVLLDEVALMPRSFVEQAVARCSVDGARFWFNCNPETSHHWFFTEWIGDQEKKSALYLHFTMEDNPSLSEETKERYRVYYKGAFYSRYILGMWVPAEGLVYPMFGPVCLTDTTPAGEYYVSIDYGTVNPCSMGLWSVSMGKATRISEYYWNSREKAEQKTDEEYYVELVKLAANRPVRSVIVDPSAASFIECIRRHGHFAVMGAENDVMNGIRIVSGLLNSGKLLINKACKDSIREFELYRWDESAEDDRPLKENDHAMDDIRYFCNTVLARTFRWDRW